MAYVESREPCQERSENWFAICSTPTFTKFQEEGKGPIASSRIAGMLVRSPLAETLAMTRNPIRSSKSGERSRRFTNEAERPVPQVGRMERAGCDLPRQVSRSDHGHSWG